MPIPIEPHALNADVGRVLGDLDRYAGWLGRGVEPTRVRDDVKALFAAIESGFDIETIVTALEVDLPAVVRDHVHQAGDGVAEVMELAMIGAGDLPDMGRPAPARLVDGSADRGLTDVDQDRAPTRVGTHLVGCAQALRLQDLMSRRPTPFDVFIPHAASLSSPLLKQQQRDNRGGSLLG